MTTKVSFWTPIKYEGQAASCGQKIRELTDAYFYLGGRVAVVMPGVTENGSIGVRVQEERAPVWKTALKVASYFTVILPTLMFLAKVISRVFYSFHISKSKQTPPDEAQESRTSAGSVQHDRETQQTPESVCDSTKRDITNPADAFKAFLASQQGDGSVFAMSEQTPPDEAQESRTSAGSVQHDREIQQTPESVCDSPRDITNPADAFKAFLASLQGPNSPFAMSEQTTSDEAQELSTHADDELPEEWVNKASKDDCNFTEEEFLQLLPKSQQEIFKIANIHISLGFLQKLRDYGMYKVPAEPERADLVSYNMDAIDVQETLQTFLANLRRDGLLLKEEEFTKIRLKKAEISPTNKYINKRNDIGRILGRDYIERTANRLNLPYIKVPKKIAVIQLKDGQPQTLEFRVPSSGSSGMDVWCPGRRLEIYAEMIKPIEDKATREQMKGLLDLIFETGFNDFIGWNLLMGENHNGEKGIYFIDTEYNNFSHSPAFCNIGSLRALMDQKDHLWFREELEGRFKLYDSQSSEREIALREEWDQQEPELIKHGFRNRSKPFVINVADILEQQSCEEAVNE